MQTQDAVLRLNQELAGTKVLSVYLNAEDTDPANRRAWRIRLSTMLKKLEDELAQAPSGERRAFREAVDQIQAGLEEYNGLLPGRGWMGFATADALRYAAPSPAPMPDLVRWEDGAHVAPYIRALKQARPVTGMVIDRRHGRIFRYVHGELTEEGELSSDIANAESTSRGSAKRAATHSGVRGESGEDAARRSEEASTQRMLREAQEVLSSAAKKGHLLVLGGNSETVAALVRELPERARERLTEVQSLHTEATAAELKQAIETAASELSVRLQRELVQEVLDATRAAGRGCVGPERTQRAIEAGAVDTLILTRAFSRTHPDLAEQLVDRALEKGAVVEEISDVVAGELDREGGIGARLRFPA